MTVLHKGQPRYAVATVTGYTIRPGFYESSSRFEMTSYTVLDRAHCHRVVATFPTRIRRLQHTNQDRARMVCDALNNGTPVPWWEGPKGRLRYGPPEP